MTEHCKPNESGLMAQVHRTLRERITGYTRSYLAVDLNEQKSDVATPAPETKARRRRSLQCCHRPSLNERLRYPAAKETGAYVPEASARIENDLNLTDGARRCARKVMEETYRRNREGRTLAVTVSYLARALGKCRRTVQRYLRQLEDEGYIGVDVACGERSRLCVGVVIRLLGPLFPQHHKEKWPGRAWNLGATGESQNHRVKHLVSRNSWAIRCMDGVFRALMKTKPLDGLPPLSGA